VDLNRSPDSPTLHSEPIRTLPEATRAAVVRKHYVPYRKKVAAHVTRAAKQGTAIHLSIHSFTPIFKGEVRDCDIGLLFDPARPTEARFARRLGRGLKRAFPDLRVRANKPYKGTDDGQTTSLRRLHPESRYVGIEIEFNQRMMKHWMKSHRLDREMSKIAGAIRSSLEARGVAAGR
jgi:predicted N-formylglutamate amidohydrolase